MAHKVADGGAQIMGHPAAFELSLSCFFVRMESSMISAITPSLRLSRASSDSIFLSAAVLWVSVRGGGLKAAAPFSKNVRCH
jgi:hypothetical protein